MIVTKDYSISCARLIAMCFIVACHIMQRDGFSSNIKGGKIEWAYWFNIGVQMFLFISGYLYGKKDSILIVPFYKKSFPKILVDYYVFILVILFIIRFSPLLDVNKSDIYKLITLSGTVQGLGHLWFIPIILFCYFLTPVFSEIINAIDKKTDTGFWIEVIVLVLLVHIIIKNLFTKFNPAWINCFAIGMIYSRIERRNEKNKLLFNGIILAAVLLIIPLQFRIDYWSHKELPPCLTTNYVSFTNYGHVVLGISAVIVIRFIYNKTNRLSDAHPVLNWSDTYSYDVYLVHHIFVQSAFGCVEFISNRWIAIPMAVGLTICFSIMLKHSADIIRKNSFALFKKMLT